MSDAPPPTAHRPVSDSYHGVTVVDEYRWLEENGSPEVKAWTAEQNAYTRRGLDRIAGRAVIAARVSQVLRAPVVSYPYVAAGGDRWFVLIDQPPKQQPFLAVMPAGGDLSASKVVLDPNLIDPSGLTAIEGYEPSPDGRRVAVWLAKAGSESGDLQVIDVQTGASSDPIPRVSGGTAGGDLAWAHDGKGFYYTRYPRPGERPDADLPFYQQLYFHRLGSDASGDRRELGPELPKIAEVRVDVDPHDGRVLVSVQNGDGGQFEHYLKSAAGGAYRQLTRFEDGVVHVAFGPGADLFAVTRREAPRGKVLRVPGKSLDFGRARVLFAPERETIVTDFWSKRALVFGPTRWYATLQLGGPSEVQAFDYRGARSPLGDAGEAAAGLSADAATPAIRSVRALARDGDRGVLFRAGSFVDPGAWYRFDERSGRLEQTPLVNGAPLDLSSVSVVPELATSKDGTQVPFNVLVPAGLKLAGDDPCVVTGYGGYGISIEPRYDLRAGLWLERGVIHVVANLRGGGEFGQSWREQGRREHKQNVFDDFAAVLQRLHARGYCRPERTAITGGSNGGLLMGATLVQHPELFRATVSFVGFYDSLRSELSANGEFNVTEFGTVRDPAQFQALYAYSPYHHVVDGAPYPRALFITGDNDPRVDPMHSRKMVARLQASGAGGPYLLRTSANAGHGHGSDLDELVAQTTDAVAFILDALAVPVS